MGCINTKDRKFDCFEKAEDEEKLIDEKGKDYEEKTSQLKELINTGHKKDSKISNP